LQINVKQARKRGCFLEMKRGDQSFLIHNRYDPQAEAKKWWNMLKEKVTGKNVLLLGGGLGYFSRLIRKNASSCTVIELLPPFQTPPECPSVSRKNKDRFFYEQSKGIEDILKSLPSKKLMDSLPVVHPGYGEIFPELLKELHDQIILDGRRILRERQSRRRFFWPWFDNFLQILPEIEKMNSIKPLVGGGKNTPGLLVGAGPSLSRSLNWLNSVQNKVIIIAVDTALRTLQVGGVKADFVLTLDPQEENAKYLQGVKPAGKLVASWSARPEYYSWAEKNSRYPVYISSGLSSKRTVFPFSNWFSKFIQGVDFLQSGGSVSATGLDFAQYLQCDPIGIIGLDHGYTGMRGAPGGSVWEENKLAQLNRFKTICNFHLEKILSAKELGAKKLELATGINGNMIYTTDEYLGQNKWFEEAGKNLTAECLDLRDGGLIMKNWKPVKNPMQYFESAPEIEKTPDKSNTKVTVDWKQFETEVAAMLSSLKNSQTPPPAGQATKDMDKSRYDKIIRAAYRLFEDSPDNLNSDRSKTYTEFQTELCKRLQKLIEIIRLNKLS
jgi:hypothetical protein